MEGQTVFFRFASFSYLHNTSCRVNLKKVKCLLLKVFQEEIFESTNQGVLKMKKVIILFLISTLAGCAFIYSKDETVKSVGISKADAGQVLDEIQQKPDDEKIKIWPRKKKNQ